MPIEVVVGSPQSDIGKGWLAASVARGMENPLSVKIDPMLNDGFPPALGVFIDGKWVTDDARTYLSRGLRFHPEQNIVMGQVLKDGLTSMPVQAGVLGNEVSKLTYADVSVFLADNIHDQMERAGTRNAVIEVGGCPDDQEAQPIPGAVRLLDHKYGAGIILITKFDFSEVNGKLDAKTRPPVRAIEQTMARYWNLPLHAAFIRRANVPESISDDQLLDACGKVAFKTQIDPKRVIYLPNVDHPEQIDPYVEPVLVYLRQK